MIKIDMEMPRNCKICNFNEWAGIDNIRYCVASFYPCKENGLILSNEYDEKRHEKCPLIKCKN